MRPGCGIVGTAGVWMAGTALGLTFSFPLPLVMGLAAGTLALGVALAVRGRHSQVGVFGTVLLVALANAELRVRLREQTRDRLIAMVSSGQGAVAVDGRIGSDPIRAVTRRGTPCVRFELRDAVVSAGDGVAPRVGAPVAVTLYGAHDRLPLVGRRCRMVGRLRLAPSAPGWRRTGSRARMAVSLATRQDDVQPLPIGLVDSVWLMLGQARTGMAALLSRGIEDAPMVCGIVRAMVLGYRSAVPDSVRDDFRRTGTMHVFAISGLHVGILCSLVVVALGICRCSRVYWGVVLAPPAFAYAVLTGGRPSAMRACVMAVVFFTAPLFRRRPDVPASISMAAILILAWAPAQLYDIGFLFSFVVVGGIVLLYPVFERPMRRIWARDAGVPFDTPVAWWQHALRYIGGLVCISVTAWLASTPLTAYYFGQITPIAVVANMFVVPLAFLVILSSVLAIVVGSCWAWPGVVFNHATLALVTIQVRLMHGLGAWRWSSLDVPRPGMVVVVLWYALLLLVGMGANRQQIPEDIEDA